MSSSEVYVKVDLVALRALIRDGSVTLKGSRHREPARSVTVWLGLAEDLARDEDPPFPPTDGEPEDGSDMGWNWPTVPRRCEDCGIRLDRHGSECGMEIDDPRAEGYFPPAGWARPASPEEISVDVP